MVIRIVVTLKIDLSKRTTLRIEHHTNVYNTAQQFSRVRTLCKKDMKHFVRCFDYVSTLKQYWNKWITAECWIDIINERYDMPPDLRLHAGN